MRIVDAHHHLWDRELHPYPWLADPDRFGPGRRHHTTLPQLSAAGLHGECRLDRAGQVRPPPGRDRARARGRGDPLAAGHRRRPGQRRLPARHRRLCRSERPAGRPHADGARRVHATSAASARSSTATRTRASTSSTATTCARNRGSKASAGCGAWPVVRHAALRGADARRRRRCPAPPRHPDHHQPHRHAARPRPGGPGRLAQRHAGAGRLPERRGQDLRPRHDHARLERRPDQALRARDDRRFRHRPLHLRQQFPGRPAVLATTPRCGTRSTRSPPAAPSTSALPCSTTTRQGFIGSDRQPGAATTGHPPGS